MQLCLLHDAIVSERLSSYQISLHHWEVQRGCASACEHTHTCTCMSVYSLESHKKLAHAAASLGAFVTSLSHFLVPSLQKASGKVRLTSLRRQSSVVFLKRINRISVYLGERKDGEEPHSLPHYGDRCLISLGGYSLLRTPPDQIVSLSIYRMDRV